MLRAFPGSAEWSPARCGGKRGVLLGRTDAIKVPWGAELPCSSGLHLPRGRPAYVGGAEVGWVKPASTPCL